MHSRKRTIHQARLAAIALNFGLWALIFWLVFAVFG